MTRPYLGCRFKLAIHAATSIEQIDAQITEMCKVLGLPKLAAAHGLYSKLLALELITVQENRTPEEVLQHIKIARARAAEIAANAPPASTALALHRSSS